MGTNSSIAILKKDGTVSAVTCHYDGNLAENGMMLLRHYQDAKKIKQLMELGELRSLGSEVDIPLGKVHNFSNRLPNVCLFYGRDTHEDATECANYSSLEDYLKNGDLREYNYLFNEKKNTWFYFDYKKSLVNKLLAVLIEQTNIHGEKRDFLNHMLQIIKTTKEKKNLEKILPIKDPMLVELAKI